MEYVLLGVQVPALARWSAAYWSGSRCSSTTRPHARSFVTTFLCGVGALLTLIWGVKKHTEWNLQKVMNTWAVFIIVNILAVVAQVALGNK
jgi:hypothetical protein